MKKRAGMRCPKCGAQMNRHAEKLIEPRTAEEARTADPALGGILEQVFGCPKCGWTESRRAG